MDQPITVAIGHGWAFDESPIIYGIVYVSLIITSASFARWKGYSFILGAVAGALLAVIAIPWFAFCKRNPQSKEAPQRNFAALGLVCVLIWGGLLTVVFASYKGGFTDDEIRLVEKSMREEFSKEADVTVTNVVFGPNKGSPWLEATVTLQRKASPTRITKRCKAFVAQNHSRFWWSPPQCDDVR